MSILKMSINSMTSPPAKIHLTSSTKLSLHDRFTKLAKTRPNDDLGAASSSVRRDSAGSKGGAGAIQAASAKNRRLAMQMGNRPSVKAALKIKKRSIRQRLGGVSAALAAKTGGRVLNNRRRPGVKRLNEQKTPTRRSAMSKSPLKSRLSGAGIDPARLSLPANSSGRIKSNLAQRLSIASGNGGRIRTKQVYVNSNRLKQRLSGGGGGPARGGRLGGNRIGNNNRGPNRNRINNNNNNKRNVGRRPGPPNAGDPSKTKQNLDMDLAQYMSKSKAHLDADLDVYMAQSSTSN